jgi:uncharacterized protein (DUF58 family)
MRLFRRASPTRAGTPASTAEVLARIRRIEIRARRLVDDLFIGQYHSVFRGRGMEFEEVREYQPGDDVRSIDWNVTARMGEPFIKKFREERELVVLLLVDVSASQDFGTGLQRKHELAAEIAALLAYSAIKNKDKVGLIAFSDRVERYLPPRKGAQHVLRLIREVLYLQPAGTGTDLGAALEDLDRLARRKSVVFILSDFLTTGYERALRRVARRHDVIAVTLRDPREMELPDAGMVYLRDSESGAAVLVDAGNRSVRRKYRADALAREDARRRLFGDCGVDEIYLRTDQPYVEPLLRFFRQRSRRAA